MTNVRRWYIYLICAISLQAVTWALIALIRNLAISHLNPEPTSIAFQLAVIIIGLPVFLVHWLWAQRLAGRETDERESALRRFYLYAMMAAFLIPFLANSYDLIAAMLRADSIRGRRPYGLNDTDALIYHAVALLVLAVLWYYHHRITAADAEAIPENAGTATIRRFYVLGFSAAGLILSITGMIYLIRWILQQIGGEGASIFGAAVASSEIARLLVGVPPWLIFWLWAQKLHARGNKGERESALRKVYLYAAIFIGALMTVGSATAILAGILRTLLGVTSKGDLSAALSLMVGGGVLWLYHTLVLRDDAAEETEAPRQAGVRRLYLYLVAGIGLAALLIGLGGIIGVIIRAIDDGFGMELRDLLAWFTAAIIAGLPVWILAWRRVQNRAIKPGPAGTAARNSLVRKIYLYFFLFAGTMTVLSGLVFILFKILSWLLGENAPTLTELGLPIAFSLIAVGVWLYHGAVLSGDRKLSNQDLAGRMQNLRILVLDAEGGDFGHALLAALQRQMPDVAIDAVFLQQRSETPPAVDAPDHLAQPAIAKRLADAGLILGPWEMAVPGGGGGAVTAEIADAVTASPARKLLIPTWPDQWEWAGVDRWDQEKMVEQTLAALHQIIEGEEVQPVRPLSAGAIIGLIIGGLLLLPTVFIPVIYILENF